MSTGPSGRGKGAAEVRIIGGKWKRRKLAVADVPGLRPTANRLRETLFNWLQFDIEGLRCLDLFAGTGALGLEALSRGAGHCTFVETDARALRTLRANIALLDAQAQADLLQTQALNALAAPGPAYDLVFIDPPFAAELWAPVLAALPPRLNPGARVYLERPSRYSAPWARGWEVLRESRAGEALGALLIPDSGETHP